MDIQCTLTPVSPERADVLSLNGRARRGGDSGRSGRGIIVHDGRGAGQEELGIKETDGGKLESGGRHGS